MQHFRIEWQFSPSPFIYGFNFESDGTKMTAVMLPWGLLMAEEVAKAVLTHNLAIQRVGVVGGVGYIGDAECEVDDIFIPESYLEGDESEHKIVSISNSINDAPQATLFPDHNTVYGCLKSVFPEVGRLSNVAPYKKILHKIDALDMEFEAIYKVMKEKDRELGAIYYTMDLPKRDIHLGDTYYTLSFLEQLFSKFQRAKFHCFERIVSFL